MNTTATPDRSTVVKIAGGGAFFDDSMAGFPEIIRSGVDYIVLDYLSEVMMPFITTDSSQFSGGFTLNFLRDIRPYLRDILESGTKIVTNWGGVNPKGAAAALEALASELGCHPRIATVYGDDARQLVDAQRDGIRDMFTGEPLPADRDVATAYAYFGAAPIAAALAKGADIVITGRVVDSAITLGALIHEFGWSMNDYDRLASGTLAGHLLECSTQVTGGTFTDWRIVADWDSIGNPIAECRSDGSFVMTKPEGSGGLVSVGTVMEQMIYEISDPQAYFVPDVVCDFSGVRVSQAGPDRVEVSPAAGYAPTPFYKVCMTINEGWRGQVYQPIIGTDAAEKAARQADALFKRTNRLLRSRNLKPLNQSRLEVLGAEASYGPRARLQASREVVAMMAVDHDEREGVEIFLKEQVCAISAMAPGTAITLVNNWGNGATPLLRVSSYLAPKTDLRPRIAFEGSDEEIEVPAGTPFSTDQLVRPDEPPAPSRMDHPVEVSLEALAWARSGDKGDLFNVGVFARRPEYLPYIAATLTSEAVGDWFAHFLADPARARVDRYVLPGTHGLNFVVHQSMDGGGSVSLRIDRLAKGMAQMLLEHEVKLPRALAEQALAERSRLLAGANLAQSAEVGRRLDLGSSREVTGFQTRRLEPFGIELIGDLFQPMSGEEKTFFVSLVDTHGLVLARRQSLTLAQQRRLMEPLGRVEGVDLEYVAVDDGVLNQDALAFHSDFAFAHTPYKNLSLHALDVVDGETTTRFANGALACQRLAAHQRKRLAPLTTTAVSDDHRRRAIGYDIPPGAPRAERAAVIFQHRTAQPILYVNEAQHCRFNELDRAESDALMEEMFAVLYAPDAILEHAWCVGDIIIWDNLALQHSRRPLVNVTRRRLQRASVADVSGDDMVSNFVNVRSPLLAESAP